MLIVPLEKSFDWKKPPVVTFLLIAINCFVLFFLQSDDDTVFEEAVEFYSDSGLPGIEFPRYLDYLKAHDDLGKLERWKQIVDGYPQQKALGFLLMEMESDTDFMKRLHAREVITDTDPEFEVWASARNEFESLLRGNTVFGYGFVPAEHRLVTFITHMYLHGGFGHLFGNMLFLFLVGFALEAALGSLVYLAFYTVAGLGAVLVFWIVYPGSDVPLVGASGAIAGLMGMYSFIFGLRRIKFFYSVLFYFDYVTAPAIIMFPLWVVNEIYQLTWGGVSNVAYVAHIGGLLVGATLGVAIKFLPGRVDTKYLDASAHTEERTARFGEGLRLLGKLEVDRARALFRALHRDYPDDTEVLVQLYRAEKFSPDTDQYHRTALQILAIPGNEPEIVQRLHETFCDYLSTTRGKVRVAPASLVQLAMRFVKGGHLETAERILSTLLRNRTSTPGIDGGLLLLAMGWQRACNNNKYQQCLEELLRYFPQSEAAASARQGLGQGD